MAFGGQIKEYPVVEENGMWSFAYYSFPIKKAAKFHEILSATIINLRKDNKKVKRMLSGFGSLL